MGIAEKLLREFQELPADKQKQVLDFVEFLKSKNSDDMEKMMDNIIDENRKALEELS
jgi:uncharacterized protein YfbU (UPF0304 family)